MRTAPLRLVAPLIAFTTALVVPSAIHGTQGQLAPPPATSGQSPSPSTASPLGLAPAAPLVRGQHLDAIPSVAWGAGATRERLTLLVDVSPKPGMRVYAPGNKDYTPVQLTVEAGSALEITPTKYPKPNLYLFAPLNERVHVFDSPFCLSREVRGKSGRPSVGTLTGRLEYQACDDKVCYLPQTLSLTWTVTPH